MKPVTYKQRTIIKKSKKLPELSKTFKNFTKSILPKYYIKAYKSYYCLECGHKLGDHVAKCSNCNSKLMEVYNYHNGFHADVRYFEIHTTKDNYQVIRIVMVKKISRRTRRPDYIISEVMQHWIHEDGSAYTLALKVLAMSFYLDSWQMGSCLEFRTASEGWKRRREITGMIYPNRRKYLPNIIRNGYNPEMHRFINASIYVFSSLLANSKFETILKMKYHRLFDYMIDNPSYINDYWMQIKAALKIGYGLEEPNTWFDHLMLLKDSEMDNRNYDNIFPDDLDEEHSRLNTIYNATLVEKEYQKKLELIQEKNKEFIKSKGWMLNMVIKKDNIIIEPLKSVKEYFDEGTRMDHCVFSSKYYEKKNSLTLTAKVDGEPMETVEVSLKGNFVLQSRGYDNEDTEYHEQIVELVNNNFKKEIRKIRRGSGKSIKKRHSESKQYQLED